MWEKIERNWGSPKNRFWLEKKRTLVKYTSGRLGIWGLPKTLKGEGLGRLENFDILVIVRMPHIITRWEPTANAQLTFPPSIHTFRVVRGRSLTAGTCSDFALEKALNPKPLIFVKPKHEYFIYLETPWRISDVLTALFGRRDVSSSLSFPLF